MKKIHLLLLVISISVLTLIGCSGNDTKSATDKEDDVIKLKLGMVNNENTNYYKGAKKMAEEVAAATDNKVNIEIIAGGALGGERDMVEQTISGDLDMSMAANPVLTNWIPEMNILDQAYIFNDADQAHAAIDGALGDLIEKKAKEKGLNVVGYMESGFRNVFSNRPVKEISDFQGLKIRTMENEYHMAAFESFGALPAAIPSNEQFTALQQGTVDAAENAVSDALANGFYEVTKDITYTDHAFVYILVMMSEEAFNKIPEDLKQPFIEGVKKGYEAQRGYLVEANENAEKELMELGVEFHQIDKSALKDAYSKVAKEKGFKFDPEWQDALDKALK